MFRSPTRPIALLQLAIEAMFSFMRTQARADRKDSSGLEKGRHQLLGEAMRAAAAGDDAAGLPIRPRRACGRYCSRRLVRCI